MTALKIVLATIEVSVLLVCVYLGVRWYNEPTGNYEPLIVILGLVFIAIDFIRRYAPPKGNDLDKPADFIRESRGLPSTYPSMSGPLQEGELSPSQQLQSASSPSPANHTSDHPHPTSVPQQLKPSFTNNIGMEFVLIPDGEFTMGTPREQLDAIAGGDASYRDLIEHETPQHRVRIRQPFYLGKYPVTQTQWEAVMGNNPSRFKGNPNYPVEQVSWYDVQAFLQKLNELELGRDYQLPTEAQWEYACRAGTETPRYYEDLDAIAWYSANSESQTVLTHPVGKKLPNAWRLYDMLGNVWEWCRDGKRDYTADTVTDPLGPTEAYACRVIRGGSWDSPGRVRVARAADRLARHPRNDKARNLGFRCASSVTGR